MKLTKMFRFSSIFFIFLISYLLSGCPDDTFFGSTTTTSTLTEYEGNGATTTTIKDSGVQTDVFVYFKNSTFIFVIKDGTSNIKTTLMTWTVTDYNSSTGIATVSRVLEPSTTTALSPTFYLRKTATSPLEYSSDKSSWTPLIKPGSSDVNFLFGTKAAKPSSLLGSVVNSNTPSSVSYVGGSSSGYIVSSNYNWSGQDRYSYTEYSNNYYSKDVGFVKAVSFTSDMSSLPAYTYKREVELSSYKIYLSDGTIKEGGETKPKAPSDLSANYTYRYKRYVMKNYSGYW
ncbi:MAG TPA: hypothetical protein PK771_15340, partial [Spirochaetota bacterium]|nr:hypothetical protein [Spirochaetota bacterium]